MGTAYDTAAARGLAAGKCGGALSRIELFVLRLAELI
jgi:hypothetical protein